MATVVRMPSVLAGASEAAIQKWLVKPGDTIKVGDPFAELETEKAVVEYNSEFEGTVGRLVIGEGGSGEIGAPIAVLIAAGETEADIDAALGDEASAPVEPAAAAAPAPPTGEPVAVVVEPVAVAVASALSSQGELLLQLLERPSVLPATVPL
jgi:pyruvate dehydrogenase E2 component (dihydrolipoamide acetyltransferase)